MTSIRKNMKKNIFAIENRGLWTFKQSKPAPGAGALDPPSETHAGPETLQGSGTPGALLIVPHCQLWNGMAWNERR